MPIVHHYTDKQTRKFTFTILIYTLIILVILLIAAISYNKLPKKDPQTDTTTTKRTICISNNVVQDIADVIASYDTNNYTINSNGTCDIYIGRNVSDPNDYQKIFSKIYVLAKRYDNTLSNVTLDQFNTILNNQAISKTKYTTVWDSKTDNYLRTKFSMGVGQVTTTTDNISNMLNKTNNNSIAIIPFEQLTAGYSLISIDGNSPLSKDFNSVKYPLIDTYWIKDEDKKELEQITDYLNKQVQFNNYDPSKLTSIILTGSSSIGSGEQDAIYTAHNDNMYLLNPFLVTLLNTDILQINNENTFTDNCTQNKLSNFLCSKPKYIDILTKLNTTVVGVNGNHILDYGLDAYTNTLKIYKENGIKYYGGGNNSTESNTPVIVQKNGNKIAFLGYNFLYPFSYYATKTKPGSANIDSTILQRDIQNAKKQADIVVVDMGWGYEDRTTLLQYQKDFALQAIQYGADIVIGTNSLIPQKLSINNDNGNSNNQNNSVSLVAYGLGSFMPSNLDKLRKNGSLILKVYVYNGKMIATDVIPLTLDANNLLQLAGGSLKDRILQSIR
ncbi:MAG TPA: CapA family protein [Candidatus Dojkabacteria bacterium]|nr:CapA family protein [Candidatus Dojkabacteria bacterium]